MFLFRSVASALCFICSTHQPNTNIRKPKNVIWVSDGHALTSRTWKEPPPPAPLLCLNRQLNTNIREMRKCVGCRSALRCGRCRYCIHHPTWTSCCFRACARIAPATLCGKALEAQHILNRWFRASEGANDVTVAAMVAAFEEVFGFSPTHRWCNDMDHVNRSESAVAAA